MNLSCFCCATPAIMQKIGYAVVRCQSITFVYCVKTAKGTAEFDCEYETVTKLSNGAVLNDLECS